MDKHQLVIIGGGSAGIACALGAAENGSGTGRRIYV